MQDRQADRQQLSDGGNRQPDDVRVRPVDSRNEPRRQALNGVRAGLVAPFPARDVPGDLVSLSAATNQTAVRLDAADLARAAPQADAGQHLVRRPDSRRSIAGRVVVVARLAEDLAVDDHGRVGAEDDRVGSLKAALRPERSGARSAAFRAACTAADFSAASRRTYAAGVSPARTRSSTSADDDLELVARRAQQLGAARRGRREDEAHARNDRIRHLVIRCIR